MHMSYSTAVVAVLALLLGSDACFARGLEGQVKKGIYTSPAGNFRVPVPQGLGMQVSDGYDKDGRNFIGAVSFHDDFGSLVAIFYMKLEPDQAAKFDQGGLPRLAGWLPAVAMPIWFVPASPESRILHQEDGTFENMPVSLAQVEIPGGSALTTIDPSGRQTRVDSVRGLIIFRRGNYIYMLAKEQSAGDAIFGVAKAPDNAAAAAAEPEGQWKGFVSELTASYQSVVFID
jgi:hypothetical protein